MTVTEALAQGQLTTALEVQRATVARTPTAAACLQLVELLGLAGNYEFALQTLAPITDDAPGWPAAKHRFTNLLTAAARRASGRRHRFIEPEPLHLRHRWAAFSAISCRNPDRAIRHIDRADRLAPALTGHIDGREFDGLRDTDDLFASGLEVLIGRRWIWLGWESLRCVRLTPPAGTLDLAFRPASLTLATGEQLAGHLPLIYPNPPDVDDVFRVGLETDFTDITGPLCGIGARLLQLSDEETRLADVRQLDLRPCRA